MSYPRQPALQPSPVLRRKVRVRIKCHRIASCVLPELSVPTPTPIQWFFEHESGGWVPFSRIDTGR